MAISEIETLPITGGVERMKVTPATPSFLSCPVTCDWTCDWTCETVLLCRSALYGTLWQDVLLLPRQKRSPVNRLMLNTNRDSSRCSSMGRERYRRHRGLRSLFCILLIVLDVSKAAHEVLRGMLQLRIVPCV